MTEVKKAGPLGRLIRLLLGLATLSLFVALVWPLRAGLWSGEAPLAPPLGMYVWSWLVAFTVLLGSAHTLAAVLGTPGCEMRSYAHLWTLLRGGDTKTVVCPGGIDRFDHIGAKT